MIYDIFISFTELLAESVPWLVLGQYNSLYIVCQFLYEGVTVTFWHRYYQYILCSCLEKQNIKSLKFYCNTNMTHKVQTVVKVLIMIIAGQ